MLEKRGAKIFRSKKAGGVGIRSSPSARRTRSETWPTRVPANSVTSSSLGQRAQQANAWQKRDLEDQIRRAARRRPKTGEDPELTDTLLDVTQMGLDLTVRLDKAFARRLEPPAGILACSVMTRSCRSMA